MRTGVWEVILTAATASLVLSTAAWSQPIPQRIEGIGEIRLCMSEEEFRSKAPAYFGPYDQRISGEQKSYTFSDVAFRWPPGTDLIPSSIQVEFRDGVLVSLQLNYDAKNYSDQLMDVYNTIRNYLLYTYPVHRFSPFTVYVDPGRGNLLFFGVADQYGNRIILDAAPYWFSIAVVFVNIEHMGKRLGIPPIQFCRKTR